MKFFLLVSLFTCACFSSIINVDTPEYSFLATADGKECIELVPNINPSTGKSENIYYRKLKELVGNNTYLATELTSKKGNRILSVDKKRREPLEFFFAKDIEECNGVLSDLRSFHNIQPLTYIKTPLSVADKRFTYFADTEAKKCSKTLDNKEWVSTLNDVFKNANMFYLQAFETRASYIGIKFRFDYSEDYEVYFASNQNVCDKYLSDFEKMQNIIPIAF